MSLTRQRTALVLWILLGLFVCRVLGQLVAALFSPVFLPSMDRWYSGLMPYEYLLPSQILIIIFLTKIALDMTRGQGYWARPKRKLGLSVAGFGVVYLLAMIIRFAIQGLSIPVLFHWVLASYLILVGSYHLRRAGRPT